MQEFLEVIREECGAPQWSKGVTLARDKAVMLQNKSPAEVECLVITQNGLNTFEVVLYLEDEDWSCSCNGDCCAHVAAATIALKQNKFRAQDDESKSEGKSAAPHPQPIQYHLEDGKFGLNIRRKFKVGNELCNIEGSIGLLVKGETHTRPVLIRHMDHAFERYIGMRTVVTASRSQLQRFFKYLKDCDQIYYDGKKVALVGTTTGVILDISDHPQGYWVELKQDKSFHKLIGKAVLLKKDKAYLLESELLMSPNVQAYRHGCVVHPTRTAKLVAEVIPQLQGNTEICNHSKFKLPSLVTTSAEVSFHIEKGTYSYDIVPQIVYGNPPLARVENGQLITLGNQVPRRNIPKEEELKKTSKHTLQLA